MIVICEVFLSCNYEVHDRREFQKAGHFVHGRVKSDQVHILTLSMPIGESTTKQQVLRVQAESLDEARGQMTAAVKAQLLSSAMQQDVSKIDYDSYLRMHKDVGDLNQYLRRHYLWEIQRGLHVQFSGPIQTAIHYLHKERSRLLVRLLSLFRRAHEEPDIDPDRVDPNEGA